MADQVQIKFDASIRGLIAGVEEVKEAIASIREPVNALISGFRELAKATGAAFAGDKIDDLAKEMVELGEKAKEAQRQINETYNRIAGPLEHHISGSLTDAVLGIRQQGGIRQVEIGIEKSVVGGMMNNLVKGIGDSLVKPLFTSLFPQGSMLGGIGNMLFGTGSEATKISLLTSMNAFLATIAGATATTAAASSTTAVTGPLGSVFSAIGSIPVLGSVFKGIGSFFGGIFTYGGIVPSAAGGWSLPAFAGAMPALLHSQEMVLPADLSQGLQGMIRGGGAGDMHVHLGFHGPSDGASIGRWFAANRGDLADAIRGAWDSGALALP
jgi:hypothetical protein